MRLVEVPAPAPGDVAALVAQAAAALGLTIALDGTLKAYPGSRHWHLRRGSERGTLEVTWWPAQRRLWFKVAAGRTGAWIEQDLPRLQARLSAPGSAGAVLVSAPPTER